MAGAGLRAAQLQRVVARAAAARGAPLAVPSSPSRAVSSVGKPLRSADAGLRATIFGAYGFVGRYVTSLLGACMAQAPTRVARRRVRRRPRPGRACAAHPAAHLPAAVRRPPSPARAHSRRHAAPLAPLPSLTRVQRAAACSASCRGAATTWSGGT
jgi:hypothetical protein